MSASGLLWQVDGTWKISRVRLVNYAVFVKNKLHMATNDCGLGLTLHVGSRGGFKIKIMFGKRKKHLPSPLNPSQLHSIPHPSPQLHGPSLNILFCLFLQIAWCWPFTQFCAPFSNMINSSISHKHAHSPVVLCFVMVISYFLTRFKWSIYPYLSWLHHWHWGNHMIAPVPVK